MASLEEQTVMATTPTEERSGDGPSGEESPKLNTDIVKTKEDTKPPPSSPRRNGIPPKRPTTTARRPAVPAPSPAPKTTSTSRPAPGSGLSKPPTRPMATSSGRRPVIGVTAATASSSGHASRPSVSSVEDTRKVPRSPGVENKRPIVSGAAKRVSLAPATSAKSIGTKVTSTSDRRSTIGGAFTTERKPSSSRTEVASPTRTSSKPQNAPTRPAAILGTPRTARPPPSSTKPLSGTTVSEATKKRLSTIPASPASAMTDAGASLSDNAPKPMRPKLGTRKSTMSVTIEQRLHEMELVSQMLQVAMAEDGEETDEVKEEYGKKMDETLAELRGKLEEARRNEGKPPLGSPKAESMELPATMTNAEGSEGRRVVELEELLNESQGMVSILKAELLSMNEKMLKLGEEAADMSRGVKQATENFRKEHASLVEKMTTRHVGEIEKLRTQLADQESSYVGTLNDQKDAHEVALRALKEQLNAEKASGSETADNVASLTSEVAKLQEECRRSRVDLAEAEERLKSALVEKDELIGIKENDILSVQQELEQLQITHSRELEEAESTSSQRLENAQRGHEESLAHIRELENKIITISSRHEDTLSTKESEMSSMNQVVGNLQTELQNLREAKDRELDNTKVELIQEHESTFSKAQAEHEAAMQAVKEEARGNRLTSDADHDKEIEVLEEKLQGAEEKYGAALEEKATSLAEMKKTIQSVESEKTSLADSKALVEKALEEASSEVLGLKKVLETFDKDSQDREGQHASALRKIKEELANTSKLLEEKIKEGSSVSESYTAEVEALKRSHTDELGALKATHEIQANGSLKETQEKLDNLQKELEDARESNTASLEATKHEHAVTLETARNSHAKELADIRSTHATELDALREGNAKELERSKALHDTHTEQLEDLRNAHSREIDSLNTHHANELEESKLLNDTHAKDLGDLRNAHSEELKTIKEHHAKGLEESKALGETHAKQLDELRDAHSVELENVNEDHDKAVTELQALKVSHAKELDQLNGTHAEKIAELDGILESQTAQVKEEASRSQAALEEMHQNKTKELRQQHDASLAASQEDQQKSLSELQEQVLQHRKALADAETELHSSRELHSSTERDSREKFAKEIEELRSQLAASKSATTKAEEKLQPINEEKSQLESWVQHLSAERDELVEANVKNKETIATLTAAAEKASNKSSDTSEADRLKQEIADLTHKHEVDVAKLQETISIDTEKREKERKQGADVRDSLVSQLAELEGFRHELPAAKEQANQHQQAAELAKQEAQEVKSKLEQALATAKDAETRYKEALVELEQTRVESAKAKDRVKGHARISSEVAQELDALQIIADKEREKTDRMKKQIAEITATAEAHATRVREMEAALKVTTAELTEMKTMRANGKNFASSPAPKGNLRTSRWASESNDDGFVEIAADPEHEELGTSIEGAMAGMQEQLRQLEGVNDDLIGESERMVNLLSKATGSKTSVPAVESESATAN